MTRTSVHVFFVAFLVGLFLSGCASPPDTVRDYNTAVRLIAEKKYDTAELILTQLLQDHPDDHEAWNQLGLIAFQSKRWNEAERCFRKAMELVPTRLVYRRNLALALAEQNQLVAAREIMEQLVESDPGDVQYRLDLARVLWMLDQRQEARGQLGEARKIAPENREAQLLERQWTTSR